MQRFDRTDRVAHQIHRELSDIIEHELKDDRIGMVTVTGVDVSRDFKYATVHVTVLGDENAVKENVKALNSAAHFIRLRLNERITLKHIPLLTFQFDPTTEKGIRISQLLNDFNKHNES
ncbi:MAG: 30S ribosome-binding factor RbfA [Candidatus Latescibacterota bacterium]